MADEETEEFVPTPLEDVLNGGEETPDQTVQPEQEQVDATGEHEGTSPVAEDANDTGEPDTPNQPENFAALRGQVKEAQQKVKESEEAKQRSEDQQRLTVERNRALESQLQQRNVEPAPDIDLFSETGPNELQQRVSSDVDARLLNERFNTSQMVVESQIGTEESQRVLNVFEQMTVQNPLLKQQVMSDHHPWNFMVSQVKQYETLRDIGDPDAWRESEREKIRAELETERQAANEQVLTEKSGLPASLGKTPSGGGPATQTWDGPAPLENAFNGR